MKKRLFWLLAAAGLLAVSCVKEQGVEPEALMTDAPEITATTAVEARTKASVAEGEGLAKPVVWDKGDAISVFYKNNANLKYELKGDGGSPTGDFTYAQGFGSAILFKIIYGVYPYDKDTRFLDGSIRTTFPAVQSFTEKTFDPKSNLMVAASETNALFFKHVGGFLLLNLYGEDVQVKEAVFQGNGGEILAGPAEIYADLDSAPSIWIDPETGVKTLTLSSKEPVAVHEGRDNPTEFWLVVPPTLFEEGFTVTVTDVDGNVFVAEYTQEVEVERNTIFRMEPLCLKKVASAFAAEITWTYAEDAGRDYAIFRGLETPAQYAHTAVPLGVEEAIAAKYGEEISETEPEDITVTVIDPESGETVPADDVTVANIVLQDGELVADIAGFEWDMVYQITIQYALNTCDLTLSGSLTTIDRNREPVTLESIEYTFEINGFDEETGDGYVEKDPVEKSWYAWTGPELSESIFNQFIANGIINVNDIVDFDPESGLEDFFQAELRGIILHATPSGDPENMYDYIRVRTSTIEPYTTDKLIASKLQEFNTGEPSADDPYFFPGKTIYRFFNTRIGELVKVPFVFNYRIPKYDFLHQQNYTFNPDGVYYSMASPIYHSNKKCLEKYDVAPYNVPEHGFNIIDEKGRIFNWVDDLNEDDETYFYDKNIRVNFYYTDPDIGKNDLDQVCQVDGIRTYEDLWSQADPEDNVNFEHTVFYYHTYEDAFPMYGTLQVVSGDTRFDIPTSFEEGNGGKYLAKQDYSTFELRSWKPFYVLTTEQTITVDVDENTVYDINLLEGIQFYDGRQVAGSSAISGDTFEGDEGTYTIEGFNYGTKSYFRPMLGWIEEYDGPTEEWGWINGNTEEEGITYYSSGIPNGFYDGVASIDAYQRWSKVIYLADIPSSLSLLISTDQDNPFMLHFDYSSQVQLSGVIEFPVTIHIFTPWQYLEPFTVNIQIRGIDAQP